MSDNENNGFGMNQPDPNQQHNPQNQQNPAGDPGQQNPQNPMDNNGNWVFSDQQQTANNSNSGYSSKYGYSSYENSRNCNQQQMPPQSGPVPPYQKQEESYKWNYEDYQTQQSGSPQKPKKNKGVKVFACILGGIAAAGVIALAGFGAMSLINNTVVENDSSVADNTDPAALPSTEHSLTINDKPAEEKEILSDGKLTIPQRAEKVKSSVVGIVNYQQSSNSMYSTAEAQGSGIIMSEDGYIITNAHVIEDAIGLKVVLSDGTEYAAQIVGSDSKTDLAIIKIEAAGLPAAEFGNSDQLEVGEQVIAVGNPTGLKLGGTLTVGYVSALNRKLDSTTGILNYIQTDAAINPGNSGGALANEYGQVIGINSAKIGGENIEGLSFAISINDAKPILEDLMNYGYVKGRVRMGISIYEMDEFMARLNNVPAGIVVASIEANTPAASSGLVPYDIITAIDGQEISALDDVTALLEGKKPGDTITVTVFRRTQGYSDKELDIQIELIESVEKPAQVQSDFATAQ